MGEARRYDPYSKFGDIMLYEIDVFGFCPGFINANWTLMSESDLKQDKILRGQLDQVTYDVWKRHNITELLSKYDGKYWKESFADFCKLEYNRILNDEHVE